MKLHEFSVILKGADLSEEQVEKLIEVGCDDCLPVVRDQVPFLKFSRRDKSLESAISSALSQIADSGLEVLRIEPADLVTQPEIVDRSGLTRQCINQYIRGARRSSFPPPIAGAANGERIWHWVEVAKWLAGQGNLVPEAAQDAETIRRINESLSERMDTSMASTR